MTKRREVRHLIETILLRLGPMPPRRVKRQMRATFGVDISEAGVRSVLPRMVTGGSLVKLDKGRYAHPSWPGLNHEKFLARKREEVSPQLAAWRRMDWDAVVQKIERMEKQLADSVSAIVEMRKERQELEKELRVLNEAVEQLLSGSIDRQDLDNARNQEFVDPFS